jgi:hypothetical protein
MEGERARKSLEKSVELQLRGTVAKKIQYRTFNAVLKYLKNSNKIMYDKDGSIVWIFADKPQLKRLVETSTRLR